MPLIAFTNRKAKVAKYHCFWTAVNWQKWNKVETTNDSQSTKTATILPTSDVRRYIFI